MCLHRIIGKPEKTSGIGYKAYCKYGNILQGVFGSEYMIGGTYQSVKIDESTNKGEPYETGFHVFETIEDAFGWYGASPNTCIVKVSYSQARLNGTQKLTDYNNNRETYRQRIESPCIVADEITLLEIVK